MARLAVLSCLKSTLSASAKPTVVVVLPSPAGVGLMAVTNINLPLGLVCNLAMQAVLSLAM